MIRVIDPVSIPEGIAELHRHRRYRGMEAVVAIDIFHVVVHDEEELLPRLRYPLQPHVDAEGLTDVVVLHQVDPGQRVAEHVVDTGRQQARDEFAPGRGNIGHPQFHAFIPNTSVALLLVILDFPGRDVGPKALRRTHTTQSPGLPDWQ